MKAIQEILNSEDYEDDVAMAKACIERVYQLFQGRDWYGLKWGAEAIGPIIDKAEANSLAKAMEGLPTVHALRSVSGYRGWLAAIAPKDKEHCEECGHPAFAHGFSNHIGCVVRRPPCDCKRMYK